MTSTVLSPIAITVRDHTLGVVQGVDADRLRSICTEVLEVSTIDIRLDSAEMKAVIASVMEGVHAAAARSRADTLEMAMHAVARFASTRENADPTLVAAVICDAASVNEINEAEGRSYLDARIEAVLAACDHLLGPERDDLIAFLRSALSVFCEKRTAGKSDESAQHEPRTC